MTHSKISSIMLGTMLFIFVACNQHSKQADNSTSSTRELSPIDPKAEIEKWKKELINNKLLGEPCNFESLHSPEFEKWSKDNPNQADGLPSNDKEIGVAKADFNRDGKEDLMLYFGSQRCSGHNGGTPSFAKIIYADGTANATVMNEIQTAIIEEYTKKRASNKNLKEVTNDYLEESTTVLYTNNINGEFRLYTKNDAHCCPSYEGKYSYNPVGKKIDLQISEVKE